MILGAAYQAGALPFMLKDMEDAFARTMKKNELTNNLRAFTLGRQLVLGENLSLMKTAPDMMALYERSVKESSVFNGNGLVKFFQEKLKEFKTIIPLAFLSNDIVHQHLAHYLHDIIIYDRGENLNAFFTDVKKLAAYYGDSSELFFMGLRTLVKTYFIKDEVYVAHIMISPMRRMEDESFYNELGSSFRKKFINRPSFDLASRKIEFDFSPSPFMLKIMRHMRVLRKMLPSWHLLERQIALDIRGDLTRGALPFKELKALENIKGYREVRYEMYKALKPV